MKLSNKTLSILFLTTSALVLSGCLSQTPAEVVDKSQTYFGKNQSQTAQSVYSKSITPSQQPSIDTNGIVMQSLEPLKQPTSESADTATEQKPTSGYLISKTKVVREVEAEPTKKMAQTEQPRQLPNEDKFLNDTPVNSDSATNGDLTYEEPAVLNKQSTQTTSKDTKPDFSTHSPLNLSQFEWPVVGGKVVSRFGKSGNKFNEGINISAPLGSPVTAAGDGKVIYIGNNIEGYGNLIIVKHSGDYMTAYSHVQDILVERGVQVRKGESIATVGQTGNISAPQLHFSVRKGKKTINPEGSAAG